MSFIGFDAIFVPAGSTFAEGDARNSAFYDIAGQVVGPCFKIVVTLTSALVAIFANSLASQATSSWLVFSMDIIVLGYALWNANDNAKIIGVVWLTIWAGIATYRNVKGRRPGPELATGGDRRTV